ncbi:MAG TPA: hypothetical protein VHB79_36275 [Polyangiaceae bacterium]|nr:hypothetical protein [Polyangiaceae bacterium]
MRTRRLIAAIAVLLPLACEGQVNIYQTIVSGGAPAASGSAGTPGAGGNAAAGTAQSSGGAAAVGGVSDSGGDANRAGAFSANGGVSGAGRGASEAGNGAAAGATEGGSATSTGVAGAPSEGGAGGEACGTPLANVPADCHATIACNGSSVVDQSNVPTPANPCLVGTCNAAGVPGTAPSAAETPCKAAGGAKLCDGAGKCVRCLHAADCADGEICSDGHECVSGACTDVDCGGACPPCADGKTCAVDADCESFACDVASKTCVTPQCRDHHQDGLETDADCGGGTCPPCVLGKSCVLDEDCASNACDGLKLMCVSWQCADHRLDGFETDIDCGGGVCGACFVGTKCKTNFDCQSGHFCNVDKICQ